ncbi:MAG: hypothetical protein GEV10_05375 [Streptosporangiales bacterium]|nr:hypothetical protein [Streptosporangiales bacterium]
MGYLTAALVALCVAAGFGAGYAIGYGRTASAEPEVAPRTAPENPCALLRSDTRGRLVPVSLPVGSERRMIDDRHQQSRCEMRTNERKASTYNKAALLITVDRFGADAETSATEAARTAMTKARETMSQDGEPLEGLGDAATVDVRRAGRARWETQVHVQYGDTVVTVVYTTWLADRSDTESAAITVAREVLAAMR